MISLLLAIAQPTAMHVPAAFQSLPSVERMDDSGVCEAMRGLAARVSSSPEVEGSSHLDRVTVVCAMREVSFDQRVAADDAAAGAGLDRAVCGNQVFRQIAGRGWTLSASMTTADGQRAFRDIDCGAGSGGVSATR